MSTNLQTAKAKRGDAMLPIQVTSFSAGRMGRMLQLHTGYGGEVNLLQATEKQVQELHATLGEWLANR